MSEIIVTKSSQLETKEDEGLFEGYALTYDIDSYFDKISSDVKIQLLKGKSTIPVLLGHDQNQVVGVIDNYTKDNKGLFVKGRIFKENKKGEDAILYLKQGVIEHMSIGFFPTEYSYIKEGNKDIRLIKAIKLAEISLVIAPANEGASITDFKDIPTTIRGIEDLLREKGFSNNEAKKIIAEIKDSARDEHERKQRDVVLTQAIKEIYELTEGIKHVYGPTSNN